MTAPESLDAAPAKPVLRRLIDTDPAPVADEPSADWYRSPLAVLPALDPTTRPVDLGSTPAERPRLQRRAGRGPAQTSDEQARSLATAVVRGLLEVLEGRRPARQLRTVLTPRVLAKLETVLGTDARPPSGACVRLRTVRVCRPQPYAIEACAVFQSGARSRALAVRLDLNTSCWKCTALQIG